MVKTTQQRKKSIVKKLEKRVALLFNYDPLKYTLVKFNTNIPIKYNLNHGSKGLSCSLHVDSHNNNKVLPHKIWADEGSNRELLKKQTAKSIQRPESPRARATQDICTS